MSLLKQIHEWSLTLHPCLRDALRRLLHTSTLTDSDYDDLFALLKVEAGIPDPNGRLAQPLDLTDLPSNATPGRPLRLLSIRKLKNVNRIAPEQSLEFESAGLTVIYGDNGTGKSGYSRVLKLACRARGEKATVLPNAHLPAHQQGIPEAEFVLDSDGTKQTYQWTLGGAVHPEMSMLSVFDAHCARAYLDSEQDVAYLPYGLDLVENLANIVLPELNRRLKLDIVDCSVNRMQFQDLMGNTVVGGIISSLSAVSDKSRVEALASLNQEEVARYASLQSTLSEQDPEKKAADLKRTSDRLKALKVRIDDAIKVVNSKALAELKEVVASTQSAIAAETLVANAFRSGENLLPATGGQEWQQLFNAARAFAAVAYPGGTFPPTAQNKACVLCQQELAEGAKNRLQRFDTFIKHSAAKSAQAKRQQCNLALLNLSRATVSFDIETALIDEIGQFNTTLCPSLQTLEVNTAARHEWMQKAAQTVNWSGEPSFGNDPRPNLNALIQNLDQQSAAHILASNAETRKRLKSELAELDARFKLSQRKDSVLEAIDKLALAARLNSCTDHIRPLPVSNKSKELAYSAVTQGLTEALNREFEVFKIDHLKARIKDRVKDGKTYHKLVLDVPTSQRLADILSEGELRVMAIASFLAELSASGHSGGAIFDDPVSSLDHFRRVNVARRLVAESKVRQVVVFTHDTVFLGELRSCVEQQALLAKFYHLEWTTADFSGYCNEGLPWIHQGFKDRIDALEKEFRALKKDWIPMPNQHLSDRMRNAYSHFRATIERAVELVFLAGIVKRFETYIPVAQMKDLKPLTPGELAELNRLFKAACDVTNSHDPSSGRNQPVPEPADLEREIIALNKLVTDFRAR